MSSKVSLKLLIHKTHQKILFAEADKNFIDFLFTILALPVATITNLVSPESMVGPLKNLYQSVQNLDTDYFRGMYQDNKNFLLKPKIHIPPAHAASISSLLSIQSSLSEVYYTCSTFGCKGYFACRSGVQCPTCRKPMDKDSLQLVLSSPDEENENLFLKKTETGFVKEKISYMVMEDLTVKPMSAMSSISILTEFGVDDVRLIEEKLVYLDKKETSNLIRAALCRSSTVLSDVFLHKIDCDEYSTISEEEVAALSKNVIKVELDFP